MLLDSKHVVNALGTPSPSEELVLTGAGQVSMPRVSTNLAHGIIKSDIPTSHLVTSTMGFALIVTTICTAQVMMLVEIEVNCVELGVHVLGTISNNCSKLFVRQRLVPIRCQNRSLSSFL